MRLTVAICTYNRAELLRQTLAGIARQTFPADQFEVLVIDNNSTDHTAQVVAEFTGARPAPRHVVEVQQEPPRPPGTRDLRHVELARRSCWRSRLCPLQEGIEDVL